MNILSINRGSSSLKFTLYNMDPAIPKGKRKRRVEKSEIVLLSGNIENLDPGTASFQFESYIENHKPDAVGHRIVHGGAKYNQPCLITPEVIDYLNSLIPFAPEHMPQELETINAIQKTFPKIPQVACFDTAFHRSMPELAQMSTLPRNLSEEGVIRYGFHGLSYEYIMREIEEDNGRIIIAHLGNGASMTAVKDRECIETTMGFTPAGGLMMGTRSGDIDPGFLFYLLEQKALSPDTVKNIINKQSGLLGVSGLSSDMQILLSKENENPDASLAINLFCYQAKKFLGSLTAVLGGLDTLIFTAGIGENCPSIRQRICEGMEHIGIYLDPEKNNKNAEIISTYNSKVKVCVMKTNEALMIARHTETVLKDINDQ